MQARWNHDQRDSPVDGIAVALIPQQTAPRNEISYGRLKPPNLGCDPPPLALCERPFTPRSTGGKPQRFCSERCRRAFERELRVWAPNQITAGDVMPAQLQRAFTGRAHAWGRREVAEIRRLRMGAKLALS